jgi:hypothetical protein
VERSRGRGTDGDSWFSIAKAHGVDPWTLIETMTRGDYPRSFNIDPSGRYLYVIGRGLRKRGDCGEDLVIWRRCRTDC